MSKSTIKRVTTHNNHKSTIEYVRAIKDGKIKNGNGVITEKQFNRLVKKFALCWECLDLYQDCKLNFYFEKDGLVPKYEGGLE